MIKNLITLFAISFTLLFSQVDSQQRIDLNFQKFGFDIQSFNNENTLNSTYRVDSLIEHSDNDNIHHYKYDENGNMLSDSAGYFSGSSWRNISLSTMEYDSLNRMQQQLNQYWNAGGNWRNTFLIKYFYNEGTQLDSILMKLWNGTDWNNYYSYVYFNDPTLSTHTDTSYYRQWYDSVWVDKQKMIYKYTTEEKIDSIYIFDWMTPENFWRYSGIELYEYDSNENEILMEEKIWVSDSLRKNRKIVQEYNNNNKRTSLLNERFDDNDWYSEDRAIYSYDDNGNMTYAYYENWDRNNETWINENGSINFKDDFGRDFFLYGREIEVFYETTTTNIRDKNMLVNDYKLLQNYPNPFNPSTTIKYSIPLIVGNGHAHSATDVSLKIYDILGREVATLVNKQQKAGNYEVRFDASNLSSGLYFYRISAGNFVDVKKMMLLK